MNKLRKQLFKLLQLHSPSGKEWEVAKFLVTVLRNLVDTLSLDSYGNIYGEKKFGDSDYTVLLNAHMDTVAHIPPVPKWRKGKTEIFNVDGRSALGGDDKCGIACHLAILRLLSRGTKFNGTVKVLFTRQEELGCVGASEAVKLSPAWFDNIDAAIVVDRRGSDNIITGGWSERLCHENYTQFWEDMAGITGFEGVPQDGTISDTMVFAEHGINSVNLSAGYYSAHTKDEYIKIHELERVVMWVLNAFDNIEDYGKFPSFAYSTGRSSFFDAYNFGNGSLSYCDYCAELSDMAEMVETDDGLYVCPICANTISPCDCCLEDTLVVELTEWKGYKLCTKCVEDYLNDVENF